jgi:peptidoglycan hydrolase CwlO-like protein
VVAAVVLASSLVGGPARADRLASAQDRLTSLERQIKAQEAAITDQHAKLDALSGTIAQSQEALSVTQARLAATQQVLAEAKARYQVLRAQLQGLSRSAYMQGPLAPVAALLGANSFGDLLDRYQYLDSIQSANSSVANRVAAQAARLTVTQHQLDSLASQESAQVVHLQSQKGALNRALLDQQRRLAQLNDQRKKAYALVQRLAIQVDPSITGAGVSFEAWASLLLAKIGAPGCQSNLIAVVSWEAAEVTAAAFNPLATTWDVPGATIFNSAGVKNYPSLEVGLEATVDTLIWGATTHGYGAILSDFRACAPAETTAMDINASDWCRGCAGGLYVLSVLPLVQADFAAFANQ